MRNGNQTGLTNVTLAGNTAANQGGAVENDDTVLSANSLFSGKAPQNCAGVNGLASKGYNLDGDGSCLEVCAQVRYGCSDLTRLREPGIMSLSVGR
jgi:hypothetical protein